MKKMLLMLGAILFASAIISSQVFAYNYINSVQFVRMPARSATIDEPDSVFYNPAGLVKIKDGFYTSIGNSFIFKDWSHTYFKASYTDKATTVYSMFGYILYKNGRGALHFCNYVPEGGGFADYRNPFGIQTINFLQGTGLASFPTPSYVHAYKFWITFQFGASYALADWLAVTAGLKENVFFMEQVIGFMKLGSYSKETHRADAVSGYVGLLITPVKELAVSAIYSSECIARGKTTDKKLHYSHIAEERLPAFLAVGVNIKPNEKVSVQLSYQISFTEQQNYGNSRIVFLPKTGQFAKEYSFSYSDQFTPKIGTNIQDYKGKLTHAAGIGIEGQVTEKLLVSCGVGYENAWLNPRAQNPLDPKVASVSVGAGFKYKYSETGSVDLGALKYTGFQNKMLYGQIKLNKSTWVASISLNSKWM